MVATIGCRRPIDDDEAVDRAAGEAGQENADNAERSARRRSDDDPRREAIGQNEHRADRKIDAGGDDDEGLRHRHQRQQHALVGRGLHHIGAEAGRMIARVDREHHDEEDEREQRPAVLGEDDSASRSLRRRSRPRLLPTKC